jgi:hypothetical protein
MSSSDPPTIDLKALFRDEQMFTSRRAWGRAGFRIYDRPDNGKIMVAEHPSVPGVLFKKYSDGRGQKSQLQNYECRIDGAKHLRAFVDKQLSRHVTVPRKWLFELPRAFSRREPSHILVVERLDLLRDEQTKSAYWDIDPESLRELCSVLFHFRGMDSNHKNVPFVADGRIAFVDTEHWDRGSDKPYLHQVGEYMCSDRRKLAKRFFEQLEDGENAYFRRGHFDKFADEDTSSASSSSSS